MCTWEIPAEGTTTSFAGGVLAWADLPASLREREPGRAPRGVGEPRGAHRR
jgi:hypothetical protein